MKRSCEWLRTVVVLPLNVLLIIPLIVLYATGYRWTLNHPLLLAIGGVLLAGGLCLAAWTMRLFDREGDGTAAPWAPPKNLVLSGPYKYARNPMITGVFMMQIAEALLLNSCAVLWLFFIFLCANAIYFPFFEERDLEKRFGQQYLEYKRNVPRWIPRTTPWNP